MLNSMRNGVRRPRSVRAPDQSVTAARARVLVADDDPEMLGAVADAVDRLGYEVVRARSGADLVDQYAQGGQFDLIISDISMPWMDGLKALRAMRTAGVTVPVIVMTALTNEQIPAQVRALGAHTRLLCKPFDLEQLEDAVAALTSVERAAEGRSS
jgi:CheY-like chemotaxis protein